MSRISYLTDEKRNEALRDAARRNLPAVLSVKRDDGWSSFKTRFFSNPEGNPEGQNTLLLEYPHTHHPQRSPEIAEGDSLGVSFRRGHKKCLFATTVLRRTTVNVDASTAVPALVVSEPRQVQQLQRRAYNRTCVPAHQTMAVELWEGGLAAEHAHRDADIPVFTARLIDISAGGFCVALSASHAPELNVGDTVGCRFSPDPTVPPIAFDANFRHTASGQDGDVHLGFQIIGLEATPEGFAVLQLLSDFVKQLGRPGSEQPSRRP